MKKYRGNHVESHIKPIMPGKPSLRELFNNQGMQKCRIKHERAGNGIFEFFCWLLEPEKRHERLAGIIGKSGQWAFANRFLAGTLKFATFSPDDQRYIIAAREDGVFWRGDDIDFFREAYDETLDWKAMNADEKASRIETVKAGFPKLPD